MKGFAIAFLVVFLAVKAVVYLLTVTTRRGYATDYSRMLTIVLPIMSLFIYAGCYYVMSGMALGFTLTFISAWVLLIIAIIATKYKRYAFILVTAGDLYEGYEIAESVVWYIKGVDPDILYDDNIGMSNLIRIKFDRTKFSRHSMELLVSEQYTKFKAEKKGYKVTLLAFLVHSVEFIFDTSFLINICML